PGWRGTTAVVGDDDHRGVVVEPAREPPDHSVDLDVGALDDGAQRRGRRRVVQRRARIVKRPEGVMERVRDAGEPDHQLEATRDPAPDGALEPLELDAV